MEGKATALREILERLDAKVLEDTVNSGEPVFKVVPDAEYLRVRTSSEGRTAPPKLKHGARIWARTHRGR